MEKRVLFPISIVALVLAAIFAPACTAQEVNTVVKDISPAGACISGELLGGVTDPVAILTACAGVTIDDVVTTIEDILAATPADAGPSPLLGAHAKALAYKAQGH
jgi:hypothetical protein